MRIKKNTAWKCVALCAVVWFHHATASAQPHETTNAREADTEDAATPQTAADRIPSSDPRTLREGINAPIPQSPILPYYPQNAYDQEVEADVYADVELDTQGTVKHVEITRLVLFSYDDDDQLVEEEVDVEDDPWGFVRSAERAFLRSAWWPAIYRDEHHPEGEIRPVIVEQRLSFLWDDAVFEDTALDDAVLEDIVSEDEPATNLSSEDPLSVEDGAHEQEFPVGENPNEPVNFEGKILERGTRTPLPNIHIAAFREPDGPRVDRVTDLHGTFSLRGLPEGNWLIVIDEDEFKPLELHETIREGEVTDVIYRLERTFFDGYRSQTVEDPPVREVTRRRIETKEIQRIPGTNNDAIRSIQNMPGVARAPFSGGDLIVRGSESSNSGFYIDGMPIPGLYHFGALRAVIPSELVESIDFYPGNFGVRYGRATAGVMEVETTMRTRDRWHGHVDINLFDTGVFVEGPISEKLTLQLGVRRSYIDAVLLAAKKVIPLNLTVAPRYYDYQARLIWQINASNKASVMVFGSDDLVDLVLNDDDQEDLDPGVRGGFRSSQNFHSVLVRLDSKINDRLSNTFRAIGGVQNLGLSAGEDFYLNLRMGQMAVRDELRIEAHEKFTLRAGVDAQITPANVRMRMPRIGGEGEQSSSFDALDVAELSENIFSFDPGVYLEGDYRPVDALQFIPGLRVDHSGILKKWSFDARLGVRYHVNDDVVVKAAVGNYHRTPDPYQIIPVYGNPNLGFEKAMQYSAGAEWQITDALSFDAEVFYKDMRSLVSPSSRMVHGPNGYGPELYTNGGLGRVVGAEFFLRHKLSNRFFGWLTYTISRSERKDFGADAWRRFDNDQTHILSLIASYDLPKHWSIGGRFRLVSGNLYTPIVGSTYDVTTGSYMQVPGATNAERMPLFHQLDVRVDKRWIMKGWTLNLYLDIQNLYNRQNPEGWIYSYDSSQSARVNGLPFIPAFGIRGEF